MILGGRRLSQPMSRGLVLISPIPLPELTHGIVQLPFTFYRVIRIEERERFWYNRWSFAKFYDCKRMMKNVWYESAF